MLRLTLAQMRRSLGRLAAAGLAIAIGTAFVAATLVAGAVMTRTGLDAVAASYADADLVVADRTGVQWATFDDDDVAAARTTPGVAAADGQAPLWVRLRSGSADVYPEVAVLASDPRLEVQTVVDGAAPASAQEVAVPVPLAERLDVGIGDTVTAVQDVWTPPTDPAADEEEAGTWDTATTPLVVTGLTEDPRGAFLSSTGAVLVHPDALRTWLDEDVLGGPLTYHAVVVALDGTVPAAEVAASLTDGLADEAGPAVVRTKDEQAAVSAREATGGQDVLTAVVLSFAAVALLVAALVIANTFQVLVAQRTRTLALLRCVGADRSQLRRSVLTEAAVLGAAASVAGIVGGLALTQATLTVLGSRVDVGVPLPEVITLTPAAVLVPLLVGTAVTVGAALVPARAATRVAPLEALRPAEPPALRSAGGTVRFGLAAVALLGGVALLGTGLVASAWVGVEVALAVGILGGAVSLLGVLLAAPLWVTAALRGVGRLLGRAGPPVRLATANAVRNPRRTAATSSALVIGVTLVAMMSTGAAVARTTLGDELARVYPVDLVLAAGGTDDEATFRSAVTTVAAVPGVERTTVVRSAGVELRRVDDAGSPVHGTTALSGDPDEVTAVLRSPDRAAGMADDAVVLPRNLAADLGVRDGDRVHVSPMQAEALPEGGAETPAGGTGTELTVVVADLEYAVLLTPAGLAATVVEDATEQAWVRLADEARAGTVVAEVQDALSEVPVSIEGAALERVRYESVVDTLLAVVVGLLAAAVLIAVIGVANTLSLSVIERRRESATLRAVGLTRGGLRGALAVEGLLIAGVGALAGTVLGVLYGWAGAATALGVVGTVSTTVPWRDLAAVLLVALVAGLLASVLPGRAAARTPPVQALAVE